MSSINVESISVTHEGAKSKQFKPVEELKRILYSCMLWEGNFYEAGNETAKRICELVALVKGPELETIVKTARTKMNLRHAPLLVIAEMAKTQSVRTMIRDTVQRPDDLTELVALYWRNGKRSMPSHMKRGIGDALKKFTEYQLSKYQNKGALKLVDLFNLAHPKPKDEAQGALWKRFMNNELAPAETWEVLISKHGNKKEIWEGLIRENKLGAMAYIRNLRNMTQTGVDTAVIKTGLEVLNTSKVLPFRFISAALTNPGLEKEIEGLFFKAVKERPKLPGHTTVLVDVSGSMDSAISEKSTMTRMDSACALAILIRELTEDCSIYSFSNALAQIPNRSGIALRDAIVGSQAHSSTYLGGALTKTMQLVPPNSRLVVITDEQSSDAVPGVFNRKAYMINVGVYKSGVSFGDWTRINGFSDSILDFMQATENY